MSDKSQTENSRRRKGRSEGYRQESSPGRQAEERGKARDGQNTEEESLKRTVDRVVKGKNQELEGKEEK